VKINIGVKNMTKNFKSDESEDKFVVATFESYTSDIIKCLDTVDCNKLVDILTLLLESHRVNRIFVMGNGGSISTAAHFSNDLRNISPGFMTYCLNDVNSITCVANDRGYENVFYEQIISLVQANDLVIMLSASGNSPNLVKAIEGAKFKLAKTVAIVGFDGGYLKNNVDVCLHVKSTVGAYRAVEDCHSIICHYLVDYFDKISSKNPPAVKAGFNRGISFLEDLDFLTE
jgi:D-sedoheptulose 7-phosphate isomerase